MRLITLLLFMTLPVSAVAKPLSFTERYEDVEPCEDYIEPYFECRTNTDLYFPTCAKKKGDDRLSCLFRRGGGLIVKDPLAYIPLPSDPKGARAIREYRKTEEYKDRLAFLEDDLKYFEDYTFCFESKGSKFRWRYDKSTREMTFKVRSFSTKRNMFKVVNVPVSNYTLRFKATPEVAGYFLERRNTRPVFFFKFSKEVVKGALEIIITDISFCRGRNCKPEFSIYPDGQIEK